MPSSDKVEHARERRSIAWIDVETTGLDWRDTRTLLLEAAIYLTNVDLEFVGSRSVVIHYKDPVFAGARWDQQAIDMHQANGLWDECRDDRVSLELRDAELELADFLELHLGSVDDVDYVAPFWGGCSCFLDRVMLERDMPDVARRIHYRTIDASQHRTELQLWANCVMPKRSTKNHRALVDARDASRLARNMREVLRAARQRSRASNPRVFA